MSDRRRQARFALLLAVGFGLIATGLYSPALDAPFLSDDFQYLVHNAYVTQPGEGWWRAVLHPRGEPRVLAGGNYSPLVHAAHALAWKAFGDQTQGHHLASVLLHALNSALLAWALLRCGLSERSAAVAAAIFLLHPANVEAVAWISQLKSLLALGLALAAVLLFGRWPLAAPVALGAALLAKASAAFVLPLLALMLWSREAGEPRPRHQGTALALCLLVFAAFAPLQMMLSTELMLPAQGSPYADAGEQLRSMAAIGARYLAMAATGYGTAAFHDPEPVASWLDPWWLAGAALAPLFVWRIAVTLRRRSLEAGWWLSAAAAFVPISQLIPFTYAVADRWLYFILPGLLGGTLLALRELRSDLAARGEGARPARMLTGAGLALGVAALLAFTLQARERVPLWQSMRSLYVDSARRYPDSAGAHALAAAQALERGDRDAAIASLRASYARGGHFEQDFGMSLFAPLRDDPRYESLLRDVAGDHIALAQRRGIYDPMQLASWHLQRGEVDEAIEVIRRAIRRHGPSAELVRALAGLREARERQGPDPEP